MITDIDDATRRKTLRRYQRRATGLLVLAAAIYVATLLVPDPATWVGYVQAAAEAGMVGGLADWFAVTALFRHPLHLPIPHTAIVPRKKDQFGDSLSGFVSENFFNAELISKKVHEARLPDRLGDWLAQPDSGRKVSREAGKLAANVLSAIDPADAEAVIKVAVVDKLAEPNWGPPAGRLLESLIADGKTEPIIEEVAQWAYRKSLAAEDLVIRLVDERTPVWAPSFAKQLVGDKVYRELVAFTADVAANPDHEARNATRRVLKQFAADLQSDPTMVERIEAVKHDIMGSQAASTIAMQIWTSTSRSLIDAARDPSSLLRIKIADYSTAWGHRLQRQPELRAQLDAKLTAAAGWLADNYAAEITNIISETVRRWDAEEASEKIELMVGKDLQYIRLNGTLVGALAGLAIHAITHLFF